MDDTYTGINDYLEIQTIYEPQPVPITTSVFDSQQELLWTGTSEGRVTSYYGLGLSKYTSFRVHQNSEVRVIHPSRDNDSIFILNSDMVSGYNRFGVNIFKRRDASFQNLQCMYLNQQGRFYLGGFTDNIYDFDTERLRVLRQLSIDEKDCILMKYSQSRSVLCTGSTNGQINIRDPFSLKSVNVLHPHNGSLSDFDVNGNYLVSCGFSTRLGSLCIDRFLMVYDLRVMRVLNPVQLLLEPCFIHYIPMCSSVVAVASQSGCFQLVDTNVSNPSAFYQLYQAQVPPGVGMCNTFALSETCQAVAFGHSTGSVHLFSKGESAQFNTYSAPTTFVDPMPNNSQYLDINHEMAPLSNIPVPLTDELPISEWNKEWCAYEHRPTPKIDDELFSNARVIHGITSVQNRLNIKRNQLYNDKYKEYINQFNENAEKTSYSIFELSHNSQTDVNSQLSQTIQESSETEIVAATSSATKSATATNDTEESQTVNQATSS